LYSSEVIEMLKLDATLGRLFSVCMTPLSGGHVAYIKSTKLRSKKPRFRWSSYVRTGGLLRLPRFLHHWRWRAGAEFTQSELQPAFPLHFSINIVTMSSSTQSYHVRRPAASIEQELSVFQQGDETAEREAAQSLPRVDGGKDAWLFLAACFMLEALIWGK